MSARLDHLRVRLVVTATLAALVALLVVAAGPAAAQEDGTAEARGLRLLGMDDLQARSAYQPTIHYNAQRRRWIAYVGHHGGTAYNPLTRQEETNGTSIVDVTNPREPRYLHHLPGPPGAGEAGGAQMARVCDGDDLPGAANDGRVYMLRTFGNEGHQVWDVSRPASPQLVSTVVSGLLGTHKNFWECNTGIAYLVSGVPGWRTNRMTQVFDLSDPANPEFIRNFGLVGQEPGSTVMPVPVGLHGPISLGNRVYFGYGTSSNGLMQIVDREKLLTGASAPTPANLSFPEVSRMRTSSLVGAHTTFPVLGIPVADQSRFTRGATRDIVVIVNESTANECREAHQMVFLADSTDETTPQVISNYRVRESEGQYCERGGRFGAHSSNENMTPIYYRKIVFIAYFNAGVRAVDIRDPFEPKEVGRFIPAETGNTDERCVTLPGGGERCKTAVQTNNVEVDDRGYVYIVDRANTGMHILRATGKVAAISGQ